jgi:hypothetical protein
MNGLAPRPGWLGRARRELARHAPRVVEAVEDLAGRLLIGLEVDRLPDPQFWTGPDGALQLVWRHDSGRWLVIRLEDGAGFSYRQVDGTRPPRGGRVVDRPIDRLRALVDWLRAGPESARTPCPPI